VCQSFVVVGHILHASSSTSCSSAAHHRKSPQSSHMHPAGALWKRLDLCRSGMSGHMIRVVTKFSCGGLKRPAGDTGPSLKVSLKSMARLQIHYHYTFKPALQCARYYGKYFTFPWVSTWDDGVNECQCNCYHALLCRQYETCHGEWEVEEEVYIVGESMNRF
jgi:hypothetical protein